MGIKSEDTSPQMTAASSTASASIPSVAKPKRAFKGRRNRVDSWVHNALEMARKYDHHPRSSIGIKAEVARAYLQNRERALEDAENVAREWARRFCSGDKDAFVMAGPSRICGEIINGIHALRTVGSPAPSQRGEYAHKSFC